MIRISCRRRRLATCSCTIVMSRALSISVSTCTHPPGSGYEPAEPEFASASSRMLPPAQIHPPVTYESEVSTRRKSHGSLAAPGPVRGRGGRRHRMLMEVRASIWVWEAGGSSDTAVAPRTFADQQILSKPLRLHESVAAPFAHQPRGLHGLAGEPCAAHLEQLVRLERPLQVLGHCPAIAPNA